MKVSSHFFFSFLSCSVLLLLLPGQYASPASPCLAGPLMIRMPPAPLLLSPTLSILVSICTVVVRPFNLRTGTTG